jgi:hypothetical protein
MNPEKVTADLILNTLKTAIESKRMLNPKMWLESAFKLNLLVADEYEKLEDLRQEVARYKLDIMKGQDKRNVAAVQVEVEASDLHKRMRMQEHKCDQIEEFVRIAKKNGEQF